MPLVLALLLVSQEIRDMSYLLSYGVKIHVVQMGAEGAGSGVFITDNLILTANHIYEDGARFYLDDDHKLEATVVKRDELNDLMLLSVKGKHKHTSLGSTPKVLDEVYTVGYPLGATKVIVLGRVTNVSPSKTLIDATVLRGMSGGGVFDRDGRLIGICVSSWGDGDQFFMVAISLQEIRKLLK